VGTNSTSHPARTLGHPGIYVRRELSRAEQNAAPRRERKPERGEVDPEAGIAAERDLVVVGADHARRGPAAARERLQKVRILEKLHRRSPPVCVADGVDRTRRKRPDRGGVEVG